MKLKNKKTGEIGNLVSTNWDEVVLKVLDDNGVQLGKYTSLAELNEEWEDCEEPVGYWYISEQGIPGRINFSWDSKESIENHKEIGNYFETYAEAEKAVEKLKAFKRLKDKGISFEVKVIDKKWYLEPKAEPQQRTFDEAHDLFEDTMFVFGGEE